MCGEPAGGAAGDVLAELVAVEPRAVGKRYLGMTAAMTQVPPLTSTGFSCKDSEKFVKAKENDVVFTRKYRETLIKH